MGRTIREVAASALLLSLASAAGPSLAEEHITLPSLTPTALTGADLFAANCQECHGVNGGGSDSGPPLIHPIYEPNHHGDAAFYLAALRGSRSHHWDFGDMPPV